MDQVLPTSHEGQRVVPLCMPQLDPHILKGTITKWHKREGDPVRCGEAVLAVSSETTEGGMAIALADERAYAEVRSPVTGVLLKICLPVGAIVPIRAVVAEVFGVPSEEAASSNQPDAGEAQAFPYLRVRSAILDALRRDFHPHDDCAATRLLVASAGILFADPRVNSWHCAFGRAGFFVSPHELQRWPMERGRLCLWMKKGVASDWRCSLRISLVDEFDPEENYGLGYGRVVETTAPSEESLAGELRRFIGLLLSQGLH